MAKLTVQFANNTSKMIKDRAASKGIPQTELLRRAIALYIYIDNETSDSNRNVSITEGDDIIRDIVLL